SPRAGPFSWCPAGHPTARRACRTGHATLPTPHGAGGVPPALSRARSPPRPDPHSEERMRTLPAVLVAAHAAVIAFACHEIVAPEPRAPARVARGTAATSLDSLSLAELQLLAQMEDSLIRAIQQDSGDMAELAHLYMLHGAYDAAVGPLARALELAPERADLRAELQLAFRLGNLAARHVDVAAQVREFLELVAMAGHGC